MFDDDDNSNPFEASSSDPYDYDFQPFSKNRQTPSMMDEESMRLKIQELERREEELNRREQEIGQQQGMEGGSSSVNQSPKNNFPICYPVVHHSIWGIKSHHRRITCLMGFAAWILISVASLINFITAAVTIFSSEQGSINTLNKVQYVLFASLLAITIGPAHFFLGYWPLYQAMRTVGIGRMLLFFFLYIFGIFFCAFGMSGWYPYGVSGIITTITCVPPFLGGTGGIAGFVLNLIMCVLWLVIAVLFLVIYINAIVVFRMQNHTFQKIKDYTRGQVTRGVGSAVSTAVRVGTSANNTV